MILINILLPSENPDYSEYIDNPICFVYSLRNDNIRYMSKVKYKRSFL